MKRFPPPAVPLSPAEQRILAAFRTMDLRSRDFYTRVMEDCAEDNPYRKAPKLRLVAGGAP